MKIVRRKNQGKGLLLTSCKINGQEMHTSHEGGSMLISSKSNWYNMKSCLIFDVVIECGLLHVYAFCNYICSIKLSTNGLPHQMVMAVSVRPTQTFITYTVYAVPAVHDFSTYIFSSVCTKTVLYSVLFDTFNIITGTI